MSFHPWHPNLDPRHLHAAGTSGHWIRLGVASGGLRVAVAVPVFILLLERMIGDHRGVMAGAPSIVFWRIAMILDEQLECVITPDMEHLPQALVDPHVLA